MLIDGPGDGDASALSQPFNAGRYIDTFPVDSLFVYDYVPKVDLDAEFHLALVRQLGVLSRKLPLHLHRTGYGVYHAAELGKQVIPRCVYHPTVVLLDQGGH